MNLDFRLAELISRAVELTGSYQALQQQIGDETGDKDWTVDRRKLKKLCSDNAGSIKLTIRELKALQIFFSRRELIDPHDNMIFSPPKSLLNGFANETGIEILLTTRYNEKANVEMSSRWDLRAYERLLRTREIRDMRQVNLRDVFHYGPEVRGRRLIESIESEEWHRIFDESRALISIGSPFGGSYAAECLLCAMVGLDTPFEPAGDAQKLPFRFYWENRNLSLSSAFELRELPAPVPGSDKVMHDSVHRGLMVGDDWYPAQRIGESTNLVVAQFKNGRLRVALCGIYAPATLGLANLLADGHIPLLIKENQNHLLVATVKSTIDASSDAHLQEAAVIKRDPRKLTGIEFDSARIWNPETRDWEDS